MAGQQNKCKKRDRQRNSKANKKYLAERPDILRKVRKILMNNGMEFFNNWLKTLDVSTAGLASRTKKKLLENSPKVARRVL